MRLTMRCTSLFDLDASHRTVPLGTYDTVKDANTRGILPSKQTSTLHFSYYSTKIRRSQVPRLFFIKLYQKSSNNIIIYRTAKSDKSEAPSLLFLPPLAKNQNPVAFQRIMVYTLVLSQAKRNLVERRDVLTARLRCTVSEFKGSTVRIRRSRAAVTGDESHR